MAHWIAAQVVYLYIELRIIAQERHRYTMPMTVPPTCIVKFLCDLFCPLFLHRWRNRHLTRRRNRPILELVLDQPFLKERYRKLSCLFVLIESCLVEAIRQQVVFCRVQRTFIGFLNQLLPLLYVTESGDQSPICIGSSFR